MEKNATVITIAALIIGIGGGYMLGNNRGYDESSVTNHVMPNGMMMGGAMDMQAEMDGMLEGLSGKSGDAFDRAFLSEMIVHHQGAVQMAVQALQDGKHQELKDLAQKIITAQNAEIKQMQDWQTAWYGTAQ